MLITDMKRVIEQVSRDKGIDFYVLVKTLEEALRSAVRKKFGNKIDIEIQYNEESGELEVFQFKNVVEKITDPDFEITLEEGRKLDPECEVGDSLGTKMDTTTFGRIAAQSAKQVIIQKLKAAERSVVYENFINRKGEIINGIVQRVSRNEIIVNLGQAEAVLPRREQIPNETYRRGDRIRAYILKVHDESRGPQIVLSRTHPEFLVSLFKTEVPEITEGMISVISAAREAGSRGKIAVRSNDPDIDPVGACVGIKGNRVQSVVQELKGEKIDIIPWHIDPAKFVCNALAPAEISRVIIDEANHAMEVVVPDDSLSIAIGKQGQNVRLASRLTGWHLDVISETRYNEGLQSGFQSLMNLSGVHEALANLLFEKGYFSTEDLSKAAAEDLVQEIGVTEDQARSLIEEAASDLESNEKPQDPTPGVSADAEPEAGENEAADDADPDNSGE
ncbi:MAG: transcription termination factor NusA [Desulfobacterales bacterium]